MDTHSPKLITVRGIQKIPECAKMSRKFVDYLRKLNVVTGTRVTIVKRSVWKFTTEEAAIIQSVWYFRKQGFDLQKSSELAQKAQERRDLKKLEPNLFADLAS